MSCCWAGLPRAARFRRLRTQRLSIHARRAVLGGTGVFFTLGVVQILPLAEATVLGFTAPIFAVLLAVVLIGEVRALALDGGRARPCRVSPLSRGRTGRTSHQRAWSLV